MSGNFALMSFLQLDKLNDKKRHKASKSGKWEVGSGKFHKIGFYKVKCYSNIMTITQLNK
jgi:hypothetical protein